MTETLPHKWGVLYIFRTMYGTRQNEEQIVLLGRFNTEQEANARKMDVSSWGVAKPDELHVQQVIA